MRKIKSEGIKVAVLSDTVHPSYMAFKAFQKIEFNKK